MFSTRAAKVVAISRKIVSESKFYFGSKLLNKRATFCPKSRAWQKLNNESMRSRKKCVTLYLLFFFGKENVELGNLQGATNSGLGKHKRPPSKPIIRLSIAASSNSYSPLPTTFTNGNLRHISEIQKGKSNIGSL